MKVRKFQEGGPAPAPAPEGGAPQGAAPEEQLAQMAQAIVQQLGPEAAAMLAQIIVQMLQQISQQGQQGQPVMARKGGKLVMIGRK